jgi:uncharacterized protein (DUF2235 family)
MRGMALYAFDGTGNDDQPGEDRDTNVLDFFRGYDDPQANDDPAKELGSLYLKGVGRRARTLVGETAALAFGIGGHRRVRQALDRLENNIEAGDAIIDVVGFSRGAALALSFANEIAEKLPGVPIRFMGLWDIVAQFGLPGPRINAGHRVYLPANVGRCYHAMALDEMRVLFPLTRLCRDGEANARLVEAWFRGVHSDIGGGNGNRGMNWIALHWMYQAAVREGLPIRQHAIDINIADRERAQEISDHKVEIGPPRPILTSDVLHVSVQLVPGLPGRPHNNPAFALSRIDDDCQLIEVV